MFSFAGLKVVQALIGGWIKSIFSFVGSILKAIGTAGIIAVIVSLLLFNWYHTKFVHPDILDAGKKIGQQEERDIWLAAEQKAKDEVAAKKLEAERAVAEISKRHQLQIADLQTEAFELNEAVRQMQANQAALEFQPTLVEVKDEQGNTSQVSKCIVSNAPMLDVNVVRKLNKLQPKSNSSNK